MIEIKEEIQIGNVILEKGDKIQIIKESKISVEELADKVEEFVSNTYYLLPEFVMPDLAYELQNRYPR